MVKDVPKEVQDAMQVIFDYADDASLSIRTKAQCKGLGYECNTGHAWYFVAVISREEKGEKV